MDLAAAQRDLASAHIGGAPGVFMSGIAWLAAAMIEQRHGVPLAFAVLFVGGMLIVPASLIINRMAFGASAVSSGNSLERLGLEATAVLFAGILIGYVLLQTESRLALPALTVAIGARYFVFHTLYGEPAYWVLGGVLAAIGTFTMINPGALPLATPLLVGLTECLFAALLLARWKRRSGHPEEKSPQRSG